MRNGEDESSSGSRKLDELALAIRDAALEKPEFLRALLCAIVTSGTVRAWAAAEPSLGRAEILFLVELSEVTAELAKEHEAAGVQELDPNRLVEFLAESLESIGRVEEKLLAQFKLDRGRD